MNVDLLKEIHKALNSENMSDLKSLFKKYNDFKSKDFTSYHHSIMIAAAKIGDDKKINFLYEKGIIKKAKTPDKAMHVFREIVFKNNIKTLDFFISLYELDKPFDEKKLTQDTTSIEYALRTTILNDAIGHGKVDKIIIKKIADISYLKDNNYLHMRYAILCNNKDAIDVLFDEVSANAIKELLPLELIYEDNIPMDGHEYVMQKLKVLEDKKSLKKNIENNNKPRKSKII